MKKTITTWTDFIPFLIEKPRRSICCSYFAFPHPQALQNTFKNISLLLPKVLIYTKPLKRSLNDIIFYFFPSFPLVSSFLLIFKSSLQQVFEKQLFATAFLLLTELSQQNSIRSLFVQCSLDAMWLRFFFKLKGLFLHDRKHIYEHKKDDGFSHYKLISKAFLFLLAAVKN